MRGLRELNRMHGYATDKLGVDSPHDYTDSYEFHFGPLRGSVRTVWEIGVDRGGSLLMWRDYFPDAVVVGIDVRPPAVPGGDRVWCHTGDATRKETVDAALDLYGPPDVVVDDGSHVAHDIRCSFALIWPHVRLAYAVEDIGTQFESLHGDKYLRGGAPFTDDLARMSTAAAGGTGPSRVCWDRGVVFVYK